jgi:hypothetical protein
VGSLIVSVCDCAHICLQGDLARVVQSALFVSAINTLVQTILGSRLPAAMGNSFYFLPITLSIVNAPRIVDIEDPHEVGVWPCFFFPPPFLFSFLAHIPPYLHPSFLPSIKQQRWLVPTHPCAEICARNEGNAGSFHRWFSPKHHSWLQWHMGHSCQARQSYCHCPCYSHCGLGPSGIWLPWDWQVCRDWHSSFVIYIALLAGRYLQLPPEMCASFAAFYFYICGFFYLLKFLGFTEFNST